MHVFITLLTMVSLQFNSGTGYQVGDKVQNFTLPNTINNNNVSLTDYKKSEGVIVVFTCNHCPYSKAYEQRIMDLDKKYAALGFPVVAINSNDPAREPEDSPEKMQELAKARGYSFPYLFDASQQVAQDFGANRTPHVFLLKNTGKEFVVAYIGAIDDNTDSAEAATQKYVEDAIQKLQKGEMPDPNFTKAIGCTIKWKQS